MKRIPAALFAAFLALLFVFSAAAESVTQMPYTLTVSGSSENGLYTGEITGGVPSGFGVFVCEKANGTSWHYLGSWEDGLMSGEGAVYQSDGTVISGTYSAGVLMASASAEQAPVQSSSGRYVGNASTKKFHYASCSSVEIMQEENKVYFSTREDAVAAGYVACKRCTP